MAFYKILFACFLLLISLSQCANPVALAGGKRDDTAPKLDSTRYSTPSKSLNFKEKEIILTFDEWIQLDQNKFFISPPLQQKPEFKIKNKSLIIKLKDTLRTNTTYTINLSEGLKDYTENNTVKNMQFVFSTGNFLDSLQVKGQIIDALTAQPKNNVLIFLYSNLTDSVVCKEKPFYFARTDEQGMFLIQNIKSDSFKIFALVDKNNNLLFDQTIEEIAFLPNAFLLTDSSQPMLKMRLFTGENSTKVQNSKIINKFCAKIAFNKPINKNTKIQVVSNNANILLTEIESDSALLFLNHNLQNNEKLVFTVQYPNQNNLDTVNLIFYSNIDSLPDFKTIDIANKSKNAKTAVKAEIKQNPANPLILNFNLPILELDNSKILLLDSNKTAQKINIEKINNLTLIIKTNWQNPNYQLVVLPNAIKDIFQQSNKDTIFKKIAVAKLEDYGNLQLNIVNLDSSKSENYILQLVRNKDEILFSQNFNSANKTTYEDFFPNLETGAYFFRIITDENQNGSWDTGDYWQKKQPENVFISKNISIRANWDNEFELDFNPVTKGKKTK